MQYPFQNDDFFQRKEKDWIQQCPVMSKKKFKYIYFSWKTVLYISEVYKIVAAIYKEREEKKNVTSIFACWVALLRVVRGNWGKNTNRPWIVALGSASELSGNAPFDSSKRKMWQLLWKVFSALNHLQSPEDDRPSWLPDPERFFLRISHYIRTTNRGLFLNWRAPIQCCV